MEQSGSIKVSVIVATYNPDYIKLEKTLKSIMNQTNVNVEIIVVDDGSKCNYFRKIEELFELYQFDDYKLLSSEVNEGTCKNIYKGVLVANGEYLKLISPGDYLYNEQVLADWISFMEKNSVEVSFGDAIYYREDGDNIELLKVVASPNNVLVFENDRYNDWDVKINYLLARDLALGAAFMAKTALIRTYIRPMIGKVIYAEDNVYRLMLALGIRLVHYKALVIWYEYGTGISTQKKAVWHERLKKDMCETDKIILHSLKKVDKFDFKYYKYLKYAPKNRVGNRLFGLFLFPKWLIWEFRKRIFKRYTIAEIERAFED